jgi:hypothetical protein
MQELLGHANIAITLDTYSHVMPGMGTTQAWYWVERAFGVPSLGGRL